jgi:hypothetical protein
VVGSIARLTRSRFVSLTEPALIVARRRVMKECIRAMAADLGQHHLHTRRPLSSTRYRRVQLLTRRSRLLSLKIASLRLEGSVTFRAPVRDVTDDKGASVAEAMALRRPTAKGCTQPISPSNIDAWANLSVARSACR